MACKNDGMGSFVGYTITKMGDCSTTIPANASAMIQLAGSVITGCLMLCQRSAPEWTGEVEQFESPNTSDGVGSWERMRFGNVKKHSEVPVDFDWPWESDFDMSRLLGSEGTLQLTGSDGSYWNGTAKVVRAPMQPNRVPGEQSVGQIVFRWLGGSTTDPAYTAPS